MWKQLGLAVGVGALVAASGGSFAIGFAVGSLIGAVLFPNKIEGRRLDEFRGTRSAYGETIPLVYGAMRVGGNMIQADRVVERRRSGGKNEPDTYTYSQTLAIAVCEGPVVGVFRIWADKQLVWVNRIPDISLLPVNVDENYIWGAGDENFLKADIEIKVTVYRGTEDQDADPLLEAIVGAGNQPAYRGLAYVVIERFPIHKFGNRIPQFEFEVARTGSLTTLWHIRTEDQPITTQDGVVFDRLISATLDYSSTFNYLTVRNTAPSGTLQEERILKVDKWTGEIFAVSDDIDGGADLLFSTHTYKVPGRNALLVSNMDDGSFHTKDIWFSELDSDTLQLVKKSASRIESSWRPGQNILPISQVVSDGYGTVMVGLHGTTTIISGETVTNYRDIAVWDVNTNAIAWHELSNLIGAEQPLSRWGVFDLVGNFYLAMGNGTLRRFAVGATMIIPISTIAPHPDIVPGYDIETLTYSPETNELIIWNRQPDNFIVVTRFSVAEWDWVGAPLTAPGTGYPEGLLLEGGGFPRRVTGNWQDSPTYAYTARPDGMTSYIYKFDTVTGTHQQYFDFYNVAGIYDPHIDGMWGNLNGTTQNQNAGVVLFDRGSPSGIQLRWILEDLLRLVGGSPSDHDFTAQTQIVRGFLVERRQTARSAIEELQPAFFFDVIESDWLLQGINRAEMSPIVTIAEESIVRNGDASGFHVQRGNDKELPHWIDYSYFDQPRDYQIGTEPTRIAGAVQHSDQAITVNVPVVLDADEAATAARRLLRAAWSEREQTSFGLPASFMALEPGDLIALVRNDRVEQVKIVQMSLGADFSLTQEAISHDAGAYTVVAAGSTSTASSFEPSRLAIPSPPRLLILDTSLLSTTDDSPGLYVTAVPDNPNRDWNGATIETSVDGGLTWQSVATTTTTPIYGSALTALPDTDRWTVWDRDSNLDVQLASTSAILDSVSDRVLLSRLSANALIVGDEIIQFGTAEQIGTRTWRLSNLLRAKLGTDPHVGGHSVGDRVLLLTAEDLRTVNFEAAGVGQTVLYRAVSDGFTSAAVAVTQEASRLKPWVPYFIKGVRDGSGNLDVTFLRRSRVPTRALWSAPLNEAMEAFEIDVMDGPAVVRTIATNVQSFAYTAAAQTTDFGSPQAEVTVRVHQLSASVGRGYPGTRTV